MLADAETFHIKPFFYLKFEVSAMHLLIFIILLHF